MDLPKDGNMDMAFGPFVPGKGFSGRIREAERGRSLTPSVPLFVKSDNALREALRHSVFSGATVECAKWGYTDPAASFGAYELERLCLLEKLDRAADGLESCRMADVPVPGEVLENMAAAYVETVSPRWNRACAGDFTKSRAFAVGVLTGHDMSVWSTFRDEIRHARHESERMFLHEAVGAENRIIVARDGKGPMASFRSRKAAAAFLSDVLSREAGPGRSIPERLPTAAQLGMSAMAEHGLSVNVAWQEGDGKPFDLKTHLGPYYDLYQQVCEHAGGTGPAPAGFQRWSAAIGRDNPDLVREHPVATSYGRFFRGVRLCEGACGIGPEHGLSAGADWLASMVLGVGPVPALNPYDPARFKTGMNVRLVALGRCADALAACGHIRADEFPSADAMAEAGLLDPGRTAYMPDGRDYGLTAADMEAAAGLMRRTLARQAVFGLYGTDELRTGDALSAVEHGISGRPGRKLRTTTFMDAYGDLAAFRPEGLASAVDAERTKLSATLEAEAFSERLGCEPAGYADTGMGRTPFYSRDCLLYYAASMYGRARVEDALRASGTDVPSGYAKPKLSGLSPELVAEVKAVRDASRRPGNGAFAMEPDSILKAAGVETDAGYGVGRGRLPWDVREPQEEHTAGTEGPEY